MGASGFIGGYVMQELLDRGHEVTGTARSGRERPGFVALDITDSESCREALRIEDFEAVINLAGVGVSAGSASTDQMDRVNRLGSSVLAKAALSAPSGPWFVNAASSTEVPKGVRPESEYGASKARGADAVAAEFAEADTAYASAVIHNTYGPDQPAGRFVMSVFEKLGSGQPMAIHFPQRVRDFCFVQDVAERLADIAENPAAERVEREIGTGVGTTLWDAAEMIRSRIGADESLLRTEEPQMEDAHRSRVADPEAAGFALCATSLADGIEIVAEELL